MLSDLVFFCCWDKFFFIGLVLIDLVRSGRRIGRPAVVPARGGHPVGDRRVPVGPGTGIVVLR